MTQTIQIYTWGREGPPIGTPFCLRLSSYDKHKCCKLHTKTWTYDHIFLSQHIHLPS